MAREAPHFISGQDIPVHVDGVPTRRRLDDHADQVRDFL